MRVLAAYAVLFFAGCLVPPGTEPVGEAATGALRALTADVPCEAEVGEGTSANLKLLGEDPLSTHGYATAGEISIAGERAYVARYGTGGFSIVDISDPTSPSEIGVWDPEVTDKGLDVKALPDGSAVAVAGELGIHLVDVRDPANPVVEAFEKHARKQAHMMSAFRVGERDYLATTRADGEDLRIHEITGGPGAHGLEVVASLRLTPLSRATPLFSPVDVTRPHDIFFAVDPLLAKPLLWVSNVWYGFLVLDVSDPANPRELGGAANSELTYTHTTQSTVMGDRRVTITVSELGMNRMRVYDTTDLASPKLLAEWNVDRFTDPQHNLQIVPPYAYMAHYAHGVFVFRLDDLVNGEPAPIARLASSGDPIRGPPTATPSAGAIEGFVGTWDVNVKDGLLYVSDGAFRAVAFGCVTPGDPAATSVG